MEKIKAVIFDMDGVLIDTEALAKEVTAQAIKEMYQTDVDTDDFENYHGVGPVAYVQGVLAKHGMTLDDPQPLVDYRAKLLKQRETDIHLFPGTKTLVDSITIKKAIGTSANRVRVPHTLKLLDNDFDAIVTFDDVSKAKPDPEIYFKCAQQLQVDPAECVVIEDAPAGIQAAKAAGMMAIGVTNSVSEQELVDAGADMIIYSLEDISAHDLEIL